MKEQTPIEWLVDELKKNDFLGFYCDVSKEEHRRNFMIEIIERAKDMEHEKLYESYLYGMRDESER